jgi:hypothetical protein
MFSEVQTFEESINVKGNYWSTLSEEGLDQFYHYFSKNNCSHTHHDHQWRPNCYKIIELFVLVLGQALGKSLIYTGYTRWYITRSAVNTTVAQVYLLS